MANEKEINESTELAVKKKPGRKPMTAEEKAAAAKARTEQKEKENYLKPTITLQFQGTEVELSTLVEAAKADFRQAKKRTPITGLKLYVKPEEHAAYYVINDKHSGSIFY